MENKHADVVIIGGGIIGNFAAYFLTKEGRKVTILDKGPIEKSCSHANCGLICPSHAYPLNSYSLILKSIKWLFKPDSPFFIRPQMNLSLYQFMLKFALNAREEKIEFAKKGRTQLLVESKKLYESIISEEKFDCYWQTQGLYFAFMTQKAFDHYGEVNEKLKEILPIIAAEPLIGSAFKDAEPAIHERVYGAWNHTYDSSVKPNVLVKQLKERNIENGVTYISECTVSKINSNGKKITSVETNNGSYTADQFLLATGSWSPILAKQLGISIPIIPGKGYSITMKSPKIKPQVPIIMEEAKIVASPWGDTYRLGGTMEFTGYKNHLNHVRINALKRAANEYLVDPYTEDVIEEWTSFRPMTPDGLPIIDQSPKHDNMFFCCGHNMIGLSLGTGSGKLITELMTGKTPFVDLKYYSFRRL